MVRQVTDTNAAETRTKIQIGDAIPAIDGKDACKMWHHEVQAALAGTLGAIKKLRLRRSGELVDVEVSTAEMFGGH